MTSSGWRCECELTLLEQFVERFEALLPELFIRITTTHQLVRLMRDVKPQNYNPLLGFIKKARCGMAQQRAGDKHKTALKHMWSDAKKLVKFCSLCRAYRWVSSQAESVNDRRSRSGFRVGVEFSFFRGTSWLITQFGNVLAEQIVNDVGLSCATVNTTRLARGTFGNFKLSFRLKNSTPLLRHVRHWPKPLYLTPKIIHQAWSCSHNEFLNVVSTYVRRVPHEKFTRSEMRRTKSSVRMY